MISERRGAGIGTGVGNGETYNQYDGFAGFALRGLGSDATLTLLNGRRMASVGMTESPTVSVLPAALIERIDIVPDGASATYGADAVAGDVTILLLPGRADAVAIIYTGMVVAEACKKGQPFADLELILKVEPDQIVLPHEVLDGRERPPRVTAHLVGA